MEVAVADGDAWSVCAFPGSFRRTQQIALDGVDDLRAAGRRRACVVLPPGAGKTAVGLEVARRLGQRTLVLAPTPVAQEQWLAAWDRFGPPGERHPVPGSCAPHLRSPVTVLTPAELTGSGLTGSGLTGTEPHGPARALADRAAGLGPWTVVLDGCEQLLPAAGDLLEVLGQGSWLLGLTATPPDELDPSAAALHERLFRDAVVAVPLAAAVQTGDVAPFQELVYLTEPTREEQPRIEDERRRFAGLQTELLSDADPFAQWLLQRFGQGLRQRLGPSRDDDRSGRWCDLEREQPALSRAALRLVAAGRLPMPAGARLGEPHQAPLDAADWAAMLDAYARDRLDGSTTPDDARRLAAVREVLPGLGFTRTDQGLCRSASVVDRGCALSASKVDAAVRILQAEHGALGDDLRAVVLCDTGQGPPDAAEPAPLSASGALTALARSQLADVLRPVLVTGRSLALRRADVVAFRDSAAVRAAGLRDRLVAEPLDGVRTVVRLDAGPGWTPARWTALVTAWLIEGGTRCVVGTRGLLGVGWDCPPVNVVVDLTVTTAPAAVTQLRGRSLRRDDRRPDKVADLWTVICVADGHPDGGADHLRAAAKHAGHLAPSGSGEVVSGLGHCDQELSPYHPPDRTQRAAVTRRALARATQRAAARAAWRVDRPHRGRELPVLQLHVAADLGLPAGVVDPALLAPSAVVDARAGAAAGLPRRLKPARAWPVPLTGAALATGAGLAQSVPTGLLAGAVTAGGLSAGVAARRYGRQLVALRAAPADSSTAVVGQLAAAVADALHGCGLTGAGPEALRVQPRPGGWVTCGLDGDPDDAGRLAAALEQLLGPVGDPRWLVSRLVLPPPGSARDRRRLARAAALGRPVAAAVAWYPVPAELSGSTARLAVFETAWWRHAGPGRLVRTAGPDGPALLELLRPADAGPVTAGLDARLAAGLAAGLAARVRTVWR